MAAVVYRGPRNRRTVRCRLDRLRFRRETFTIEVRTRRQIRRGRLDREKLGALEVVEGISIIGA